MADDGTPWWTRPPEPSPARTSEDTATREDPDEVEVRHRPEWTDRDEPVDRTELMDLSGRAEREDRTAAAEAFSTETFSTEPFGEPSGTEPSGTGPRSMNGRVLHTDEPATEALAGRRDAREAPVEHAPPATEALSERDEPATEAFSGASRWDAGTAGGPATEALPDVDLPFGAGPPQPGVRRTVAPSPALDPPVREWGEPEYGEGVYGFEEPAERPVPPPGPATEQLPRVPAQDDREPSGPDTLGVYGTPSGVAPGIPGLSADADPLGHLREDGPRRQLPVPPVPGGPKVLAAVGGVLAVLLVVLLVRGLTGGGDGGDEDTGSEAAAAGTTTAQDTATGGPPVSRLGAAEAGAALKKVQQTGTGQVVGAWTWNDDNGKNMLVTLRKAKGDDDLDLRVVFVSKLDTDNPEVLRVMQEPNVPNCKGAGAASFTRGSVQVRDVDKDGAGEVTIGWTARCGGKTAPSVAKLALLVNKDKYILRGEGVIGDAGSGGTTPDPKSADWPKGYLKPLTEQFRKLYF